MRRRLLSLLLAVSLLCPLFPAALAEEESTPVTVLCVTAPGQSVPLDTEEFQRLCRQATGHELESVTFSAFTRPVGKLVCDEEDPEETAYYINRRPRLSHVTFVPHFYSPAACFTGQAELDFTMTSEREETVPGTLIFYVPKEEPAPVENPQMERTVKVTRGKAVDLCDHLPDSAWYQVKGTNVSENITSVTFALPPSTQGSLWLDYEFETARKLLPGEVLFPNKEPNYHSLTFVPANAEEGDVLLSYTVSAEKRGGLPASLTLRFENSSQLVTSAPATTSSSAYFPPQPPRPSNRFRDMGDFTWAATAVDFLASTGYCGSEQNFRPGDNATRMEFVHALVTAAYPSNLVIRTLYDDIPTPDFSDLPADPALAASVATAAYRGLVLGNGAGLLLPDESITRQDALVIIHRAMVDRRKLLPLYGDLSQFSDAGDVAPYAQEAAVILAAKGVLLGNDTGRLEPLSPITRAEMACLLYRAFG